MPRRRQAACSSREIRSRSLGWGRYVASWAEAERRRRAGQAGCATARPRAAGRGRPGRSSGGAGRGVAGRRLPEQLGPDDGGAHVGRGRRSRRRRRRRGPGEQVRVRRQRRGDGGQQAVLRDEERDASARSPTCRAQRADRGVVAGRQHRPRLPERVGRGRSSRHAASACQVDRQHRARWRQHDDARRVEVREHGVTAARTLAWVASTATSRSASGPPRRTSTTVGRRRPQPVRDRHRARDGAGAGARASVATRRGRARTSDPRRQPHSDSSTRHAVVEGVLGERAPPAGRAQALAPSTVARARVGRGRRARRSEEYVARSSPGV